MSQTILALLGLTILTTMTMNTKRVVVVIQSNLINEEMEIYGNSLVSQALGMMESKAFDSRTMPSNVVNFGLPADSSAFSTMSTFGNMPVCDPLEPFNDTSGCDDLDDLHMGNSTWFSYSMPIANNDSMAFEMNIQVVYVSEADPDVEYTGSNKSNYKKVSIRVRSPYHVQQGRFTNGFIFMDRIFAYDEEKAVDDAAAWSAAQP